MGKFEVLNENTWNFASNNDFVWNDTTCFNEENNRQINEKEMVAFLKQLFDLLERGVSRSKTEEYGRDKIITYMLDSLFAKTEPEDIPCEIITIINMGIDPSLAHTVYQSIKNKNNKNNNITTVNNNIISNNQINSNIEPERNYSPITDDSKPGIFLFLTIISFVLCGFLFFRTIGSVNNIITMNTNKIVSSIMLPIILLIIGIIFFGIFSKEKNKRQYYEICKSMEYWLGHKSDELIIAWGTPTKTSKLPQDKSTTLLEYKDIVRNYTGYSTRSYSKGMSFGYHSGQSRSTKYNKTFYVQNGIIIGYKYTVQ